MSDSKSRIIAEHLIFKFLNDKFNYCGEPLPASKVDYIEKALNPSKLSWMVYMFVEKNSKYSDIKDEIEEEINFAADKFVALNRLESRGEIS